MSGQTKRPNNLIDLNDIHLSFDGNGSTRLRVIDGIDLTVLRGQFLAVLGPSGCGKSTLLRVLAGLLQTDRGSVTWADGLLENRPSRMAMNFQKPVLLPWLSLEDNALLPFRVSPRDRRLVPSAIRDQLDELLDLTGLAGFRHALPHELSGGMQMRAALVRTLITKPDVILMDEPFAAIDELTRQDLGREFRSILHESRASTVFVTHSIQEASFLADRILIMSPRPARVIEDIQISYETSERSDSLRRAREYLDLCDHLREVMAHDY